MQRVAVVGGAGFIGTHCVRRLLATGVAVRVLDRPPVEALRRHFDGFAGDLALVSGSLEDEAAMAATLEGVDHVVHLASTTAPASSNSDIPFDISSNLIATIRLLEACRARGIAKLTFLSSGGTVYGQPITLPIAEAHPTQPICSYGVVKLAIEKYIYMFNKLYGSKHVVLRVSNPYGPGQNPRGAQGVVAVFTDRILRQEEIVIWGDGEVVRDYIHVSDVAEAVWAALLYDGGDCIFNIGSGQGVSLNEIIAALNDLSAHPAKVRYETERSFDVKASVLDISAARTELNWAPRILLKDGLTDLLRRKLEEETIR